MEQSFGFELQKWRHCPSPPKMSMDKHLCSKEDRKDAHQRLRLSLALIEKEGGYHWLINHVPIHFSDSGNNSRGWASGNGSLSVQDNKLPLFQKGLLSILGLASTSPASPPYFDKALGLLELAVPT